MILDDFIDQAVVRHGRLPERMMLTPMAAAALAVKNVRVPPEYRGVKLVVLDPRDSFITKEPAVGKVVALIVEDNGVFQAVRLVDVE
jgi:hypothetical protein